MARNVQIDLRDYARYISKLGNRFEAAALKGLRAGALRALPVLHKATRIAPPASPGGKPGAFNYGDYLRAWKAQPIENGVRLMNDQKYASIIEEGRRAGKFPPKEMIVRWAQRRLGLKEADARRAAFVIARAIAQRGLTGRHVLGNAMPELRRVMLAEMERELENA